MILQTKCGLCALEDIGVFQSVGCVWLCDPVDCSACQASLSFTISLSLLKLMSIESVMPSTHLILCHPLLLLPSICPSIKVFSNESALCIRWPKYWSFNTTGCLLLSFKKEGNSDTSYNMDEAWGLYAKRNSQSQILKTDKYYTISLTWGPKSTHLKIRCLHWDRGRMAGARGWVEGARTSLTGQSFSFARWRVLEISSTTLWTHLVLPNNALQWLGRWFLFCI